MELLPTEYSDMIDEINQELLIYVPEKPPEFSRACRMSLTGGKHIRGLICTCSCVAVGGIKEVATPLAVSVELMQAFSLVHDDIIDNDAMRRGKASIHTEFSSELAVIVGDYLHGTSYRALHNLSHKNLIPLTDYMRILDVLYQAERDICIGQGMDMQSEIWDNLDECLDIAEKKTGTGFMAAAKIGAIAGGGTDKEVSALSNYGMYMGISYQIRDDILDIFGSENKLGKPLFSDVRRAKNTIVLSHLFSNVNEEREFLLSLAGKKEFDNGEISKLKRLLIETGSIEFAQNISLRYIQRAKEVLKYLRESKYKAMLIEVADYVAEREF